MIKDYQIFKEQINLAIQNSGLNIGIIYFILKDIFTNIEKLYYAQINRELMEQTNKNGETQVSPNTENIEVAENA